ncbi:MAG: carboxymuconolactone decarboxylase family protein [Gammaproteobacteria bacterium]|nr:carboxymuconolactone decarboxylase family protein [Gammaproteobacteria bacterium]
MTTKKTWFLQSSPEVGSAFLDFHTKVTEKNSLDDKTMELIKIAVSSVLRCPHCTQTHVVKAKERGASKQEITDTLLIASLQAAGTQLYWDLDGFEKHLGGT